MPVILYNLSGALVGAELDHSLEASTSIICIFALWILLATV
jgi:hypothetical protein